MSHAAYFPVLIIMVLVIGMATVMMKLSQILGRKARSSALRDTAYECGMPVISPAHVRFSVKFYVIAMLFILFDIEVVFMYPWATILRDGTAGVVGTPSGGLLFVEMLSFVLVLFLGWIYIIRKGVLDWNR
jgi:NADH-quinone oxidoreductase subunit A